jgi:hypothetical protein
VLERLRVADGAVELGEKSRDLPVRVLLVAGEPGVVRQLRALGLDVHEPSDVPDGLADRLVRDERLLRPLRLGRGRGDGLGAEREPSEARPAGEQAGNPAARRSGTIDRAAAMAPSVPVRALNITVD